MASEWLTGMLGADVNEVDSIKLLCRQGAMTAASVRDSLLPLAVQPRIAGPYGATFCAYLTNEVIPRLGRAAESLTRFEAVLGAYTDAQRRLSNGQAVDVTRLPRYESPVQTDGFAADREAMRQAIPELREELRRAEAEWRRSIRPRDMPSGDPALAARVADLRHRIGIYQHLVDTGAQIIHFDRSPDRGLGSFAVLHGALGPRTEYVGVLAPGMNGDEVRSFAHYDRQAAGFLQPDDEGRLAIVTWVGGNLPNDLSQAASARYANASGPRLAEFSLDLRERLTAAGAPGALITGIGHSYGGAIVGEAEQHRHAFDQVVHVSSAGMGPGVDAAGDYTRPEVARYELTPPGDPIRLVQGRALSPLGASPRDFPQIVGLPTGEYADGREIRGLAGHSQAMNPGSDVWHTIRGILFGTVGPRR